MMGEKEKGIKKEGRAWYLIHLNSFESFSFDT